MFPIAPSGSWSADLWLRGGRIHAICPPDPTPAPDEGDTVETIAAQDRWVLPGFVGVHLHLCQTLFRGMAERRDLYGWLSGVVWPLEAAHDAETLSLSAEVGIAQLLAGGTTCILDMGTTRQTEAVLEVAARTGLRGFFGPSLMDRGPEPSQALLRRPEEFLHDLECLAARWEGAEEGRLRLALCPRFVPSVSDAFWKELSRRRDLASFPIHTHGSETREELTDVERLTGTTPPRYLAALPGAEGRIKMAHGVWLDAEDRQALQAAGAAVLHCPGSNLKLGSGLCDVAALDGLGIRVGIGPDGAACNNRLDPWHEMRLAAYVRGLLHGAKAVDAAAILRQATLGGAEVLGLADQIGSLVPGKRADFLLLDPGADPAFLAAGEAGEAPEAALVFAGSPSLVAQTFIDGRLVHDRATADPHRRELIPRIRQARRTLAARSGLPMQETS